MTQLSLLRWKTDWEGKVIQCHPAIWVSSSFSYLKTEVAHWLDENVTKDGWRLVTDDVHDDCLILEFDNDEDAMLFLMRWS